MQTPISWVRWGAALAFLGVALGAFGAHTLQERFHMDAHYLDVYRTGVQYHLIHSVALALVGLLAERQPHNTRLRLCGKLLIAGIFIFGGSLYALAITSLLPGGPVRILGAITPLGGVCFLIAWAVLAWSYRPAPWHSQEPEGDVLAMKENASSVSEPV